ncbi:ImmA/IrrE family metallo-endopeptidase [Streptococcus panodentis]|uniref:ImmA/IrrE family metallo-endopeptidase n=1 Tax=Streptococcus panodentis TaxID=1581472 RepID=A0ABS5AXI5_9STRE|nr:ImmA/IrrE family metallo-endopeptidase [Streptococcus panodentis]MBP2621156.1 ImmA/IrrE family metallo-endopeptidase [Streptococcus panodentis]
MNEKELLEHYQVSLQTFDPDQWSRNGFYDAGTRTIFINSALSPEKRHQVLLHELGHLGHTSTAYNYAATRCENEANRFMIRRLVQEELAKYDDSATFNWFNFAKKYNLKTTTDELMIQDEYLKFAEGL